MQFSKNTSNSRSDLISISIKVVLFLAIIIGGVIMLGQIDFPSPNKEIKKIIPNENLKIVK
tara:strand:- start:362 stop:544 length:183 start_codon:yes stop_codon:yes gene_type:complete